MTDRAAGRDHHSSDDDADETTVPLLVLGMICLGVFLWSSGSDAAAHPTEGTPGEDTPAVPHGEPAHGD